MWPAKLDHWKHFDSIYSTKHLSTQYTTTPIYTVMILWGEHPTGTELSHPIDSSQACSKSWYFEKIFGFKCNHQMLIETATSDMDQHKFLGFWSPLVKYIHLPKILVSTLITRPKLILNAEPLDAIHMQVLVVLFNLLQIITIALEIAAFAIWWAIFLFCCTNETNFWKHGKSKDILGAHFRRLVNGWRSFESMDNFLWPIVSCSCESSCYLRTCRTCTCAYVCMVDVPFP